MKVDTHTSVSVYFPFTAFRRAWLYFFCREAAIEKMFYFSLDKLERMLYIFIKQKFYQTKVRKRDIIKSGLRDWMLDRIKTTSK